MTQRSSLRLGGCGRVRAHERREIELSILVPELDASAQRLNIRMTEGDDINFEWLVPTFSGWAGTYDFIVLLDDGTELTIANTVTAQGSDALFSIIDVPQPMLVEKSSGYPWAIKDVTEGITRFAGLLFVDQEIGG